MLCPVTRTATPCAEGYRVVNVDLFLLGGEKERVVPGRVGLPRPRPPTRAPALDMFLPPSRRLRLNGAVAWGSGLATPAPGCDSSTSLPSSYALQSPTSTHPRSVS